MGSLPVEYDILVIMTSGIYRWFASLVLTAMNKIRVGMSTLLSDQDDIELVGEAYSFQELVCLIQQIKPVNFKMILRPVCRKNECY